MKPKRLKNAGAHGNLTGMIKSAHFSILSLTCVTLFASSCATQATPAPAESQSSSKPAVTQPATSAAPATPIASNNALLPPVPQPPERPVAPLSVTDPALPRDQRIENFVTYTSQTYGVNPQYIRDTLNKAVYQQKIIDAMNRPAEAVKPWSEYRKIFLVPARIDGGKKFYLENKPALDKIAAETGVPAEYIVAIIGVETMYGKNTGSYRVLDALYTLAFDFPKRAPFFAGELAQLFALTAEEKQLDILQLKGSYAGAMGMGQFMPSSYRNWGKDGDNDGRRDLITHKPDVFASIAKYFVDHGWQKGGPVVARAQKAPAAAEFKPETLDPVYPLSNLQSRGFTPQAGQPAIEGATLLSLDGEAGREYWFGYRNFYVITRYNRSPMYALSVHQLAQAIREGTM